MAAKTLLQHNPCSLIAKFRIDLMHKKIRLTNDELSPRENRYSLNADASLGANEVSLIVDVASLRYLIVHSLFQKMSSGAQGLLKTNRVLTHHRW